jgi:hypothetical protein
MHTLAAMTFTATVHNGAILLPPGIALPEGAWVEVHSDADTPTELKGGKGLLQFAGIITDKPSDFAAEHDHYIHGTPKRGQP